MQNKRLDFLIEEAGCLIWVAPRSLGGLTPAQLAQVWMGRATQNTGDLVKGGVMMPMSLYQDDGYLVRFILGELSQQEQAKWTARALWKLDISCGEVLISGILTPDFNDEFSAIVPAEPTARIGLGLTSACHRVSKSVSYIPLLDRHPVARRCKPQPNTSRWLRPARWQRTHR